MFLGWYFINIGNCFNTFYPTPLISISEVMIQNHGNGPKSTHGACPGSKKHKTVCTLACLTPLLYMPCMETTLIMPVEDILSNILKMLKNVNKCVR